MKILRLIFCFTTLLAGLPAQAVPPSYTYVDLGVPASLSGNTTAYSYATGINDAGTIVGAAGSSSTNPTAIVYAHGTMTDLGAQLSGGSFQYSYAYGINKAGDIVGSFYQSSAQNPQAFLYANGTFTNLVALSPTAQSAAYAVNSSDQVVGTSLDASGVTHAFVYSGGTMHDLGFLETELGAFSAALNINDSGVVVGDSENSTPVIEGVIIPHGFYTSSYVTSTGLIDMGVESVTVGETTSIYKEIAYAIDDSGTIIGGTCPVCPGLAFIDTKGVFTYLGTLSGDDSSYATAKNTLGQIVGASFVSNGSSAYSNQTYIPGATKFGTDRRAFLYQNGTMYDLNAISANIPSGWTLVEAAAINQSGQIVGYAIQGTIEQTNSVAHAFLLNPIPALYFQNGTLLGMLSINTTFLPNAWQGVGGMGAGWQERAIADINGDGVDDIIFQNGTLIGALIMSANGTPASWVGIGSMNAGWQLRGVAEITGDGNLDLIFQNGTLLGFLEVNGAGQPVSWNGIGAMGTGWELRAVASLDGTGQPDLIFQNGTSLGALMVNTSGVPTAWVAIGAMGSGWTLSDAVDVNDDGQPDLIFQSGTSLGSLQVNTSLLPIAWHGIGAMGAGWTLPGDY